MSGSMTWAGWAEFSAPTLEKIARAEADGYEIKIGNDPYMGRRPKWAGYECLRLSQYNHRHAGYSLRTVWAIKEKGGE